MFIDFLLYTSVKPILHAFTLFALLKNLISCRCQINLIIFYVLSGILAVATTFAKIIVPLVLLTNKKLINGQAVYRISLAMSDAAVGIVVFPAFICTSLIQQNININSYFLQPTLCINAINFFTIVRVHITIFSLAAAA